MPRVGISKNYYKKGSNNVICDRTGFKLKAEDVVEEWNGFKVRKQSFEERHPQDNLKGFRDNQTPKVSRPEQDDVFLEVGEVTPEDL